MSPRTPRLTRLVLACLAGAAVARAEPPLQRPDYRRFDESEVNRFNRVAKRRGIVYVRTAEFLVDRFDLRERQGIGIDLGGGPGDMVFELVEHTQNLYWINADINTWYARPFAEEALRRGITHRTGFVFADAGHLPFRDDYADLLLSRGSYQFWGDLEAGLREIHRVLAPGGQAFVGRGLPPTMPEDEVRELQGKRLVGGPRYDPDADAERFRDIMQRLEIREFDIIRHKPEQDALNYGVWLQFRK